MDDGSTDHSADLVQAAASADPRFKLISRPHRGLCAALNAGLTHCRGELLARMDADDISLRRRLEYQGRYMRRHPEVGAVGSLVRLCPRRLVSGGMARYEDWFNRLVHPAEIRRELWVESPMCHPSVMMRTGLLRGLGGYRDRGWPEDYDLWLRMDRAGATLAKVPRLLLLWREGGARLTRTSPSYTREQFRRVKLHHLQRKLGERRVLVWGAGMEGKPWLRALSRLDLLAEQAVDIDPRKIGQVIHGCRIILPKDLPPPSPGLLVLAAVGSPGAREEIRGYLDGKGYEELRY